MKKELEDALMRDFPNLLKRRDLSMTKSCLGRGFEVGDGWEPIVREMCKHLQPLNDKYGLEIEQIKEKFGYLRVYFEGPYSDTEYHRLPEEVEEEAGHIIAQYERLSGGMCEDCGSPNHVTTKATSWWIRTLCEVCRAKEQAQVDEYKKKQQA